MNRSFPFMLFFILGVLPLHGQIGIGTTSPASSAMLDITSVNKGLLPPRMTLVQRTNILSPAEGLIVYDLTLHCLEMFDGAKWVSLSQKQENLWDAPGDFVTNTIGSGTPSPSSPTSVQSLQWTNDNVLYVTGIFGGSLTIGNFTVNSQGDQDIFFAKLDSDGNAIWLKGMGSTAYDAGMSITVDPSGNVYLAGSFENSVDFDPGIGVHVLNSAGSWDGFYAKYDSDGNWIWSKRIGGTSTDAVLKVIVNGTDVYIGGDFTGSANFNPTALVSAGINDGFVARYQSSDGNQGATGWALKIGGTSNDQVNSISFYGGGLLACGYFSSTANFGGTTNLTTFGVDDGFVCEYNLGGNPINVFQFGGTGEDWVNDVKVQGGFIYATGAFQNNIDLDPGLGIRNRISNGATDLFVVKFSVAGSYEWSGTFGGPSTENAMAIALDGSSNVYVVGTFFDSAVFSPYTVPAIAQDAFLMKLDGTTGTLTWVQSTGGPGWDYAYDLAVLNDGHTIYVGCSIETPPFIGFNKIKYTSGVIYIAKYKE